MRELPLKRTHCNLEPAAVEQLQLDPPQAVIVDGSDDPIAGLAFLCAVRGIDPPNARPAVLFVSGADDPVSGPAALDFEAHAELCKPIDPEILRRELDRLLGAQGRVWLVMAETSCAATLSRAGYAVRSLTTPAEALATLARSEDLPEALVLDLGLPDRSAYDFMATLALNPDWRDIPLLVVTDRPSGHVNLEPLRPSLTLIQRGEDDDALLEWVDEACALGRSSK